MNGLLVWHLDTGIEDSLGIIYGRNSMKYRNYKVRICYFMVNGKKIIRLNWINPLKQVKRKIKGKRQKNVIIGGKVM